MTDGVPDNDDRLRALAEDYGFATDAVRHLCAAVRDGGGDMAVFDHPEFLGPGQWMRGGLIMITDPGDRVLKNRIDAVCNALSRILRAQASEAAAPHRRIRADARAWDTQGNLRQAWWPAEYGDPAVTGETEWLAYAYFDAPRRLAVRRGGQIAWYDTGTHRITGLARDPEGSNDTLVMTSTRAEVPVAMLSPVSVEAEDAGATDQGAPPRHADGGGGAILDAIERLGVLRQQGVLTEDEFAAKKRELLDRL